MKRFSICFILILCMFTAFALPVVLVDQIGRTVTISSQPKNIVSGYYISSSACIAMGLEDNLVAIEAQANKRPIYKLAAEKLISIPNVGTAKNFNLETCLSVDPDLVILPKKQKETAKILGDLGIPSIVVNPESHEEIIEMFELIGKATGHEKEAQNLISKYNSILSTVKDKTSNLSEKPLVYICGTESFLTTAPKDMYQAKLIELAGGINVAKDIEGSSWKKISYEQLIAYNPEIIIIPTNSNANGPADFSVEDLINDPLLKELKAVKNGKVYQMPVGYEAWDSPVPSGALGALWMLSIIHPELYSEEELKIVVNDFYRELYGFKANF